MTDRVLGVDALNAAPAGSVLVVTPTYNEKDNIIPFMRRVAAAGADLLVVDDASPDGTADIIRSQAGTMPHRVCLMRRPGKLGLGTAYADAYGWIIAHQPSYKVIVQMDADFSHEPEMVPRLAAAAEGAGIAVGSRYVPGASTPDWPLKRKILSGGANIYARGVLALSRCGFGLHDGTAGFVAWRRDVLEQVFAAPVMSNGYAFQIETKYRAVCLGHRPVELPITFRDRSQGVSKISRGIVLEAALLPWKLVFGIKR